MNKYLPLYIASIKITRVNSITKINYIIESLPKQEMQKNQTPIEAQFQSFIEDETIFYSICEEIPTQSIIVNPENDSHIDVPLKQDDCSLLDKKNTDQIQIVENLGIKAVEQVATQQRNTYVGQIHVIEHPIMFQDECVQICLPVIQQKWSEDFITENIKLQKNQANTLQSQNYQLKKLLVEKDEENEKLKRQLSLLKVEKQKLFDENQALKRNFNAKCIQFQQINKNKQIQNENNQQFFKTQKFFTQKNQTSRSTNLYSLNALISPTGNKNGSSTQRKNRLLTKYMLPPTPKNNIKNMLDQVDKLSMSLDVVRRQHRDRDRSIDVTNNIQAKQDILKNVSKWEKKQKDNILIKQDRPKPRLQDVVSPKSSNKPKISSNKSEFMKKNWK